MSELRVGETDVPGARRGEVVTTRRYQPERWSDLPVNKARRTGIKRTAEDRNFSRMIRERDGWTCQRCGKAYPPRHRGLHCAHMFSRGKMSTRYDPENARACCYGCHRYIDTHPNEKRDFFRAWLGDEAFEALELRSNTPYRGNAPKPKPTEKKCSLCREVKPLDDFYFVVRSGGKPHWVSRCKPCVLTKKTSAEHRVRHLRKYGLTTADYDEMLQDQEGVCAICRRPPDGTGRNRGVLHVDHDGDTGNVRGLLCGDCNTGIAMLGHDPHRLHEAIEYLFDDEEGWPAKQLAEQAERP